MKTLIRLIALAALVVAVSSCGGSSSTSSSGGSSGFGGTGISFVRGNVVSLDGQSVASRMVSVSGGGRASDVAGNGSFELVNVNTSDNLVLTFSVDGGDVATLSVGSVSEGTIVRVPNVRINTGTGSAVSDPVQKESSPDDVSEDDTSDDDGNSEDSVSSDDDDSSDQTSADDLSEDDDSEDDDSEDDSSDDES